MGRCWREFLLPVYLGLGLGHEMSSAAVMVKGKRDYRRQPSNFVWSQCRPLRFGGESIAAERIRKDAFPGDTPGARRRRSSILPPIGI
jgi:hypothetical protein